MIKDMIKHVAKATGLSHKDARTALGIVLNASERQGSPFMAELYKKMPGARTLASRAGAPRRPRLPKERVLSLLTMENHEACTFFW